MPSIVDAEQGGIPHSFEENSQSTIEISRDFVTTLWTIEDFRAT